MWGFSTAPTSPSIVWLLVSCPNEVHSKMSVDKDISFHTRRISGSKGSWRRIEVSRRSRIQWFGCTFSRFLCCAGVDASVRGTGVFYEVGDLGHPVWREKDKHVTRATPQTRDFPNPWNRIGDSRRSRIW